MSTMGAVILSYNKRHIFPEFWQSLLNQTRFPDALVIVDDGSTDGTPDYLKRLAHDVLEPKRIGQSAARNLGLAWLSDTVDTVIFLDGDLRLQVNMLGRMELELDHHPEASFVYCHYDRTGAVAGIVRALPWSLDALKAGNFISPMTLVRRKDLPSPCFDETMERYEDWDLWIRMAQAGHQGRLIDEILFTAYYRQEDLSGKGESQDHFLAVKQKYGFY